MLLARVAQSLYWLGRYLERAENANRHLLVARAFSLEFEGLDQTMARAEWQALLDTMPASGLSIPDTSARGEAVIKTMRSFLIDEKNPVSVASSLNRARDNARTVNERLTREVVDYLNDGYRRLIAHREDEWTDAGRINEIAEETHGSILTILGAMENTLSRDEGWGYLKSGEAMERTQHTIFVLKARLPIMEQWAGSMDSPISHAAWRSVLRSVASLENYRQVYGPRFEEADVIRFLVFDNATPRSVNTGVRRIVGYLRQMASDGRNIPTAARYMGKAAAKLEFEQEDAMAQGSILPFLEEIQWQLVQTHDILTGEARSF